ncbi:hypothetical protein PMAYCL1PPCAC_32001, partial [Pristionchus mayeri]
NQVLLVALLSTLSVWCATDSDIPSIVKAHCANATGSSSTNMILLESFTSFEDSVDGKPTVKVSLETTNTTNFNKVTVQLSNGVRSSIMHDRDTSPLQFDCSSRVCAYTYAFPK